MTFKRLGILAILAVTAGTFAGLQADGSAAELASGSVRNPFPGDPWALPDWRRAPPPRSKSTVARPGGSGGAARTPFPANPWTPPVSPSAAARPAAKPLEVKSLGGRIMTPFPSDPWNAPVSPPAAARPAAAKPMRVQSLGGRIMTPFPANPWDRPNWREPAPRAGTAEMPWRSPATAPAGGVPGPRVVAPQAPPMPQMAERADGSTQNFDLFPMRWALAGYLGLGTEGGIEDLPLFEAQFNAAYIATIEPSLQIFNLYDWISVEAAANLTQYFNRQTNTEGNLFLIFRWLKFPWDRWLDTSFAAGEGVSYATPIGSIEKRRSPEVTSNLLNFLMFEIEVTKPGAEHWSGFMRIHHRSGVFGLYNGVSNGSNFLVWGLRYRF